MDIVIGIAKMLLILVWGIDFVLMMFFECFEIFMSLPSSRRKRTVTTNDNKILSQTSPFITLTVHLMLYQEHNYNRQSILPNITYNLSDICSAFITLLA